MTNVTFSLPERTVKRLRRHAADLGGRKGTISGAVDEAISRYLDSMEPRAGQPTFTAFRGETCVATAKTLEKLAAALKAEGVDPRSVRIVSSEPLEPVGRVGLRVRTR